MAMEKGLLPSGINVNDPTYSSNQQLIHICRTLLSEIEKKSRLQMDLQQAYRGVRDLSRFPGSSPTNRDSNEDVAWNRT